MHGGQSNIYLAINAMPSFEPHFLVVALDVDFDVDFFFELLLPLLLPPSIFDI